MVTRRQYLLQSAAALVGFYGSGQGLASPLRSPLTVLVEVDLSTQSRDVGRAIEAGVREASTTDPKGLRVQVINTQGNVRRAQDAMREAMMHPSILAIIGGGDANISAGLRASVKQDAIPYGIAWATDLPALLDDPWSIRLGLSEPQCLIDLMTQARALPTKRWGFLFSQDALGRASYDALTALLASNLGPQVVGVQWHDLSAHTLRAQWFSLQEQGAQMVWFVGQPRAARILANAMQTAKSQTQVPVLASSSAWSAQWAMELKPQTFALPIYFVLPQLPASHSAKRSAGIHPAYAFADALTKALLEALATSPHPANLRTLRETVRAQWTLLQRQQDQLPPALYHYGAGQWQAVTFSHLWQ